jgi:predicted regulator of Ras-like GTPase activity (Roadblock/LC7/MglB family)
MFKETLETILAKTEGSLGALIMGADGLAVEKLFRSDGSDANLDVAAAELTSLVRSAHRSGDDLGLGNLRELTLRFDHVTFIARLFNREYFLVLALRTEGNIGRGRYEMRKAELQLAKEFAL